MTDVFQIGLTSSLTDLTTVLGSTFIAEPDWSYKPYSTTIRLWDGTLQGNGFPVIKWRFNQLSFSQREALRNTYCPAPALSRASTYIHTPTNETNSGAIVWKTFKCTLNWTDEEEDFQAEHDLGVLLTFTHCEVQ